MKTLHAFSFLLGVGSGLLVMAVVWGVMHIMDPGVQALPEDTVTRQGGFPARRFGSGGLNVPAMAERLGMTQEELQNALDEGKTMRELIIEREHVMRGASGSSLEQQ